MTIEKTTQSEPTGTSPTEDNQYVLIEKTLLGFEISVYFNKDADEWAVCKTWPEVLEFLKDIDKEFEKWPLTK